MEYENCHTFNITNKTETSIHSLSRPRCMYVRSLFMCIVVAREIPSEMSVFGRNSECEKNNRIQLALQF